LPESYHGDMAKKQMSLDEQLRQAIHDSGKSQYQLAKESGVHKTALSRFMRGERDLTLASTTSLCEVLGLQFCPSVKAEKKTQKNLS
jgi:transcriptional regulator with XRE-family HTH domain